MGKLLCLLTLLFASVAWADPEMISISGSVLEKGTRKPLTDVNVFILPSKQKAVTDSKGSFTITVAPGQDTHVIVNLTGYKKYEKVLELSAPISGLKIYLERQESSVFETTVSDSRTKKDVAQQTMKQSEFLQMPGSNGDPVKAVQNLPGVNRASGFSANVVIQGGSPDDTRYNIEGMDVPLIFHFGGLSSIVQPEAVASVDLLTAGYGPVYGDALGGHVGLNLREPQTDRLHGMAFVDFFNAGGLIEGPISDTSSFMAGGRYSYIGDVLSAVVKNTNSSGQTTTVAPIYYDLHSQYVKKLSANEEFKVVGIFSNDDLALLQTSTADSTNFHLNTQFWRIIPEWHKTMGDSELDVTLGYGQNNVLVNMNSTFQQVDSNQLSARAGYGFHFSPWWKSSVGVDTNTTTSNIDVATTGASGFGAVGSGQIYTDTVNAGIYGLYWSNDIKPGESSPWTISPGVRLDEFTVTQQTTVSPRFSTKYDLDPTTTLKFLSGLYYQQPEMQQLSTNTGNPDLKDEQALHFALGADKVISKDSDRDISASVLGFYKQISQFVVPSEATVSRGGTLVTENYNNSGNGYVQGIELSGKFKTEHWGVTLNYTFSQSFLRQPGQGYYPSPYDQTHALTLLGNYRTKTWEFGGRARYVTGDPYTPIESAFYNDSTGSYLPADGGLYSVRMPAFFQLDVRADRKWTFDTWILSLYIDVQNLTNRKNVESIQYSYDYSQSSQISDLPLLPTFGVKGEF